MIEPFDFEAFISGAKLAEDTFDLYLVNNGPAIARLEAQIEKASSGGGDERESSVPEDVTALRQQVARLSAAMEASKREVTLRQLTYDELVETGKPECSVYDQLAVQSVSPKMDAVQWKRLAGSIGATPFNDFLRKANALAMLEVVVPDFSPTTSTSQDQRESSLS
jgi:hypothetical protein